MKTNRNEVDYNLQHGINDKDIDATIPAECIIDETLVKPKKKSKQKNKSQAHEAILPDPRVQTGEAVLLLAAVSSQVGRISVQKILTEMHITEDELASPLSLIHHNGMITVIANIRHPQSIADYDVQLTAKGKSLAMFLISAEQDRLESISKKAEEAKKKAVRKPKVIKLSMQDHSRHEMVHA